MKVQASSNFVRISQGLKNSPFQKLCQKYAKTANYREGEQGVLHAKRAKIGGVVTSSITQKAQIYVGVNIGYSTQKGHNTEGINKGYFTQKGQK